MFCMSDQPIPVAPIDYGTQQLIQLPNVIRMIGRGAIMVGVLFSVHVLMQLIFYWQHFERNGFIFRRDYLYEFGLLLQFCQGASGAWLIVAGMGAVSRKRERARMLVKALLAAVIVQLIFFSLGVADLPHYVRLYRQTPYIITGRFI